MAGELFQVFGSIRLSPAEECPDFLIGKKVILKSKDGFISQVPAEAACISTSIRNIIVHSGTDEDIAFPLKQATLTKVIEYMNYHQNKPAGEIRTPLESDNLQDCGASAWDAKFINVDKEMLFELILAASLLGMQSLFYLAGAKAAVMTKDKSDSKIRKDLSLVDDLPAGEEESVQSEYRDTMSWKLKWSFEEAESLTAPSLSTSTALIAGMLGAAARNDVLRADLTADGKWAVDIKSWRHATWRVAVLQNWRSLASAPEAIRADRDLLLAAILSSRGEAFRYATKELAADRELVLEAVKHSGAALQDAGPDLREDREFVLQAVLANGEALTSAAPSYRGDRGLILEAAKKGCGSALQGATQDLRRDSDFVLEVLRHAPESFQHVAEELRESRDFALAAAKQSGLTLKYMSRAFRADRQIVATAVGQDSEAVLFSHTSCRRDLGLDLPWDQEPRMVSELLQDWGPSRRKPLVPGPHMSLYVEDGVLMCEYQFTKNAYCAQKCVQFSASNVMTANMGQSNYISANSFLDKLPFFERPVTEAITLMWGAVGGIGMRLKAFGSQDFLNYTPEAQTTVDDAMHILRVTVGFTGVPEWYNTQMYDPISREAFLRPTAGGGTGGGYVPHEDAGMAQTPARTPVPQGKLRSDDPEEGEHKGGRQARAVEEIVRPEAASSPLAGWPELGSLLPAAPQAGTFVEGARVRLVGLRAKNGLTGTLVKQQGNCRWKIKMDGAGGLASLKEDNLQLLTASEAAPPVSQAQTASDLQKVHADARHSEYHIVGSWSGWDSPQAMTWDRSARCYKHRLRLTYKCESFQILLDGSWDKCLHPAKETSGCPTLDYVLEGPDEKKKVRGLHWTIGNHQQDKGTTGSQYEVRLFLGSAGKAERVSWVRLGGAVGK
mmetsp:Transcript_68831/g.222446  ORF Transcript_68831/g.222446 Transcript_68831/m.222446 type:complete len:895 (+) Transcript_68831:80-2764(+)